MELMLAPRRPRSFFFGMRQRRLSIPNVLRVKGCSEDQAVNRTLQIQVRREVEKLKGNSSASAAAAATIMLSTTTTITTTTTTATTINTISSEVLNLPSPLKKTRKTSHECQIDCQNERKAKEAYTQALARATTLIATERGKEKQENACPTQSIITKAEGEFRARGFEVSL
jgi:hypothetical protein